MDTLNPSEQRDLQRLAAMMIPASAEYGVPGADDPAIFADIIRSLGRDLPSARAALAALAEGGPFADLAAEKAEALAASLRTTPDLLVLHRLVLLCYYRDDRVMRSLGQEPRPPFPKGHVVEQGDWSLLDPVRARPPIWRPA